MTPPGDFSGLELYFLRFQLDFSGLELYFLLLQLDFSRLELHFWRGRPTMLSSPSGTICGPATRQRRASRALLTRWKRPSPGGHGNRVSAMPGQPRPRARLLPGRRAGGRCRERATLYGDSVAGEGYRSGPGTSLLTSPNPPPQRPLLSIDSTKESRSCLHGEIRLRGPQATRAARRRLRDKMPVAARD
jgi:hypothetical protein